MSVYSLRNWPLTAALSAGMLLGLTACGGGGGGGPSNPAGAGPVAITAQNATAVAGLAFSLSGAASGYDDLFPLSEEREDQAQSALEQLRASKPYGIALEHARGARAIMPASTVQYPCEFGGNFEVTEAGGTLTLRWNNCKEGQQWASNDFIHETTNGFVKVTELPPGSFDYGVQVEFDFTVSYLDREPGYPDVRENLTARGALREWGEDWGNRLKIEDSSFFVAISGSYGNQSFSVATGMRDYNYDFDGTTITYSGVVGVSGQDAPFSGSVAVRTDDQLTPAVWPQLFETGAVLVTGANGSTLRFVFNGDSVTIFLNGHVIRVFNSREEFSSWLDA
jgi:hypothetical protein